MENVIEVKGLEKEYENFKLSNISFSIPSGCVAGFIGLNGQGKTTTIRTMLGLSKKTSGSVKLLGMDIDESEKGIKDRIGVVFDEGYLYESLKMKEMKNIVAKSYTNWDDRAYRDFMEKFSLNENQLISTLSKGMKMKFALTLALSHKAELLIMDEPTSGLDPLIREELLGILSEFMKNGGKGVFYSSHITSDLDKFSDIIVFINNGEIVFVEDKDFLLDTFALVKGDRKYLTEDNKKYFVHIKETEYGFSGLTSQLSKLRETIPEIISERPNLETIMLAHVEGGEKHV